MSIAGIVAEYNPFHLGHALHLQRTKELLGEDTLLVCVMSGDVVQRGEAAILSKFARAEAACRCGVDLVLELPLPWCLSSAEAFAFGAVSLLDAVGCTHLSFGSELGCLEPLQALAERMTDPRFPEEIKAILAETPGMSFAKARELAAAGSCGELAAALQTPNNILAVEYLKALRSLSSPMTAVTVLRSGSRHDGEGGELCSAAELRRMLKAGKTVDGLLPDPSKAVLDREIQNGRALPDQAILEAALLSRLLALREEDFDVLPDAADGLGHRLYAALRSEAGLDAVMMKTKTKRYALSRIRRLVYGAALGVKAGMTREAPPYARVLAASPAGRGQLRSLRGETHILVLTRASAVSDLGARAQEIFSLGSAAHDLLALSRPAAEMRVPGEDWKQGPFIL